MYSRYRFYAKQNLTQSIEKLMENLHTSKHTRLKISYEIRVNLIIIML